jgi:ribosomal protein S18 acetylase RimI-like enzyme
LEKILLQTERKNFIWLNDDNVGLGFISFGEPKDINESADIEIYGIYVHPNYWGRKIGYYLMNFGIDSIMKIYPTAKIVLWTMEDNMLRRNFYKRYGFKEK